MKGDKVDYAEFNKMIDTFFENGFNYFDTAHGYLRGQSEIALHDCLVARYPREKYVLANKLSDAYFQSEADVRPFFESQLKICGVDYFDFYLMHAQDSANFPHYKRCRAYEQAFELKAEGKIKHVGLSFHDTYDVLDQILTEYPQVEFVQIQFNYLDYDNPAVQSRQCYEVCLKHNKPIIIMEPVKGGHLVNLPKEAQHHFDELGTNSAASYALRYAAGFPGVFMVLSGMSNMAQMQDNLLHMKNFKPLNKQETAAIEKVLSEIKKLNAIACTACRYCIEGCPKQIAIPDLFDCMNNKKVYNVWGIERRYRALTETNAKASACIKCGKCEHACPQHLPIRDLLASVAKEFEK